MEKIPEYVKGNILPAENLNLLQIGNVKGWPWGLVGFCDFFKGFLIISQILGQM